MDVSVFEKIIAETKKNKNMAYITVLNVKGTTPSKKGMHMIVCEDGSTEGTVGGGNFELNVIEKSLNQIKSGESSNYIYEKESVEVEVFINVFKSKEKLIIVGAGHVGYELYKIAKLQNFYTVIVDSRPELVNRERFVDSDEIYLGDVEDVLKDYNIDEKSYVVICGPTHEADKRALKICIDRNAKYIGMLGSRRKISQIKEDLISDGILRESLNEIYSPIGISIGGNSVPEIAFGILGEIIAVKNNSKINHMKDM